MSPEEKVCTCCGAEKQRIGETITEQLEYIPASLFVIEHAQLKYVCKGCQVRGGYQRKARPAHQKEYRGREGPEDFLQTFRGDKGHPRYIQCDAYAGYNGLFAKDRHVLEVACWAHARRKYDECKTDDPVRVHDALLRIKDLYKVEAEIRDETAYLRDLLRRIPTHPNKKIEELFPDQWINTTDCPPEERCTSPDAYK